MVLVIPGATHIDQNGNHAGSQSKSLKLDMPIYLSAQSALTL